ncbi:neuferricin isoform X1 [Bufo gargarizans]|uniref:neuferricin isoform X1 n=1 Tax=Bufo gargarizans TaxID=30331 RepID=UPI001CF47CED|nr:neuferricin isoform X1 [Bufo gargarizans]
MLGYLAAAAVCLAAVLVLRTDPWSFPEVPGLSYIFPEQCKVKEGRLLSREELSRYHGGQGSPGLYLAVLGQVFDVQKGIKHYGPGGSYSFFAGPFQKSDCLAVDLQQGTRTERPGKGCLPSLRDWRLHRCWPSRRCVRTLPNTDVTPQQLAQLLPEELCRGKLIGHFYDEDGDPTKALEDALTVIDVGLKLKEQRHEENKQFPPCNSEFSSGASKVWCSKNSGGIKRDWVGVPRKLYLAGYDGYRCVCVRTNGPPSENPDSKEHNDRGDLDNPSLKEYKDCNPLFDWCWLKE